LAVAVFVTTVPDGVPRAEALRGASAARTTRSMVMVLFI
jgi:hypothetical protein